MKYSNKFCILPWMSTHIEANGKILPCCMSTDCSGFGNLHSDSIQNILNSDKYKKLRKYLMDGKGHPNCEACNLLEGLGQKTLRNFSNEKFEDEIENRLNSTLPDGEIRNLNLSAIDLRFSNICNFKCRTCNDKSSTTWYEDSKKINSNNENVTSNEILYPTNTKEEMWDFLDSQLPSLREIYILGGEPLIDPDHYYFLEKLIQEKRTKIHLRYSTNLSTLFKGKKSAIELWSHFEKIHLSLSYDGYGQKGEFIRKGMNWENTLRNHRIIQSLPKNISFMITPTISILNVFHLVDFLNYLIDKEMISNWNQVGLSILNSPDFFNIKILKNDEITNLKIIFNEFILSKNRINKIDKSDEIISQLNKIIEYIETNTGNYEAERRNFVIYNFRLNKIRAENMRELFPELRNFYKESFLNFNA